MDELKIFLEREHRRLNKRYQIGKQQHILARAVKLSEEVGELNAAILSELHLQRKDKLKANLEEEFADVILTTHLLAKSLGIEINLSKKIKKIEKRLM